MATVRNQAFHHVRGQIEVGQSRNRNFDRVTCNRLRVLDQLKEVGAVGTSTLSLDLSGPWQGANDPTVNFLVEKVGPGTASLRVPTFTNATEMGAAAANIVAAAGTLTGDFEPDQGEAQTFLVPVDTEGTTQMGRMVIETDGSITFSQDEDGTIFTNNGGDSGLLGGTYAYLTSGAQGVFDSNVTPA